MTCREPLWRDGWEWWFSFETETKFSEKNQVKNFILEMIWDKDVCSGAFAVAAGVINIFYSLDDMK